MPKNKVFGQAGGGVTPYVLSVPDPSGMRAANRTEQRMKFKH